MNLAKLGLTGLNAAQSRLQAAGHNITNAATEGYNRQSVLVATAGALATSGGYVGRGVQPVTVQRAYDGLLQRQLVSARSTAASLTSYANEIAQINNLFADNTVGITPALQKFFDGIQAVASAPADAAARQELLGRSASLVAQLNDANAFIDAQRSNINTQISTTVAQINSYVERVRDLNQQITHARASASSHQPNDLLDQREQLVAELAQLVGVRAVEQGSQISLTVGNGQVLLAGDTLYPLHAKASDHDPERTVVAVTLPGPNGSKIKVEIGEPFIVDGSLGGLISYRRNTLDSVQNELGRLAMGLAVSINAQHSQGVDLTGRRGDDFFALNDINVIPSAANSSAAMVVVELVDVNQLRGLDYRVERTDDGYSITRLPGGGVVTLQDANIADHAYTLDGFMLRLPANGVANGDAWLVQPTRAAASGLTLLIDDPAAIAAAASYTGTANGDNGLALAKIQTAKVLGNGSMSLNEAFSQIVNKVAVHTQQNTTASRAQATLINQTYAAQQTVSGVNLNEEYVSLEHYQQQFIAASRLIDVSGTLFDTLLRLRS
ncbi:flagellar hook-associated protein FlgK [Pusillimonas sp. ANT_WB101]|uniref:flagellar hook-associated protein FlgK n=1 Tax=Pusillimonas sp. ANT_WB101 TaxID=2597356 RepID=UPI0011EDD74B|nr:flagellar hook-associated protein FlgK [Pusillimonas sp. ANT_WB101]KAA0910760.1 flagellar hook-associated protein FlgK [Pusillimonas sp. ANT_WB101]